MNLHKEFEVVKFKQAVRQRLEQIPKEKHEEFLLGVIAELCSDFLSYQEGVAEMFGKINGLL